MRALIIVLVLLLIPVVGPSQVQREGYDLDCVSRIEENLYGTADNLLVRTQFCLYRAQCEAATLYPGRAGRQAEIVFPGAARCRVVRVWKEPSR